MLYFEVKIRETKTLVPRDDGSTFFPEKHGKLIRVDVFAFSQKQLNPKNEKLSPYFLRQNGVKLICKSYGNISSSNHILGEIYIDLKSIKKIDKLKYEKRKLKLAEEKKASPDNDELTTNLKARAVKPKPVSKTKNAKPSPENRLMFMIIAGSTVFFGIQFVINPNVAAFFLVLGLVLGPLIVGLLSSVALAKEGELDNKGAGFVAAAIFALVSIILLNSDLIDDARNAASGVSYNSMSPSQERALRKAAEDLYDKCEKYGKSYDSRC